MKKVLLLAALAMACESSRVTKKLPNEACQKNLDCTYGLECVEGAAQSDGGVVAGKTCQYKAFGDCDGDGPGPNGQPQCVSGQKCRDGHCTVQCAGKGDCREGEVCKIGVCQRASGQSYNQCYDNRDCTWPEVCFYGQCVTHTDAMRCQTDLDCGSGGRCIGGRCM